MNLLRLSELVFTLFLLLAVITQVIIPMWKGYQLFPIFRKRWDLEGRLEEEKEKTGNVKIEKEILKERKRGGGL